MTEDYIFQLAKDGYLSLIHPAPKPPYDESLMMVINLAPRVSTEIIQSMLVGASWRERLLGLCFAMTKPSSIFADSMLQSLRDPRGIAIVPTCAALAVMSHQNLITLPQEFAEMFDRSVFDGEMGWALDKALHFTGRHSEDISDRGPNYGQSFADHTRFYEWLSTTKASRLSPPDTLAP